MKVFLSCCSIICLFCIVYSPVQAQSKVAKKAAKEAAKIMCKCTAIQDMASTIETYQNNPNLVVTEEVSNQVKGYIQKATTCLEKFEEIKKKVEESELKYFNDAVEEQMADKCPDILKVINAFAEME